jgi:hypothetical protein
LRSATSVWTSSSLTYSDSRWLSQGGRDLAAAHLLPRAEAALRQELLRLADAVKRAREGQS